MFKLRKLLAKASVFIGLTGIVHAQQQPAADATAPEGASNLQQITVTGYLVPRVGTGPAPVVTLDQQYIQNQGAQSVSDVIQRLPQNVGSFTPAVNTGLSFSPSQSSVNLRGLGDTSTLVLIDGLRQTAYPFPQNGTESTVDLNSIPLAAVDRIEVLKDGASATYGSDAIAGVVNVILKDEYQGADLNLHYGISSRGDAEEYHASLVGGISEKLSDTSKFSILAAFDYYQQSPIQTNDRSYAQILDHSKFSSSFYDQLSGRAPAGNFGDADGNLYSVNPGNRNPNTTAADFTINGNGNTFNPGDYTELLPRVQRYGGFVKLKYEPTQWLRIYDEFLDQHTDESDQAAPTPAGSTDGVLIPATNPHNPFGVDLSAVGWRPIEFGARKNQTTTDTLRNVVGIQLFNLPKNWFVDASFLYSESDGETDGENYISKSKLNQALNGTLPGFVGQFYNPFVDTSTGVRVNDGLVNATKVNTINTARTDLRIVTLKGGGELFTLPGGPVTLGLGAEYRNDSYVDSKDADSKSFNIIGAGGGSGGGKRYVRSVYAELTIPIFGDKLSFPGMRSLEVVLAERYDNYSDFGEAAKPKVSLLYKPFDDLVLRATYSEGFRAPTLPELFGGELISYQFLNDPVTGIADEYQLRTTGNPNLQPETSYSYYAGAVWSPGASDPEHSWWGWANGFTAYIDWSEIVQHNAITQLNPQFELANLNVYGANVFRNPDGTINYIIDPFLNLGSVRVDSLDFGASYNTKEFSWGALEIEANASWIYDYKQQNVPGGIIENLTDTYALTDFKMTASIFYKKTLFGIDTFRTGVTLNYVDSEHDQYDDFQRALSSDNAQANGLVHRIGSFTTLDWQISYEFGKPSVDLAQAPAPGYSKDGKRIIGEKAVSPVAEGSSGGIRKMLANAKLTFGIINIGDVRPPFSNNSTGYDPQQANSLGRYFYVEVGKKF